MAAAPQTLFHLALPLQDYAEPALLKQNPLLDAAKSNSKVNSLPEITVTALQGQYLALQCRLINAKSILEVGTLGGYSTIWFASTGAHVTSIEIDPERHAVASENTKSLENVTAVLGDALEVMPKLVEERKKFDFVFIDASWGEQWEFFDLAVKLTRSGGCVYVDNVVRKLFESVLLKESKESLVTKVGKDQRVDATLVPTVNGSKEPDEMFDGFILAYVK